MAFDGVTHPTCQRPFGLDGLVSVAFYEGPVASLIQSLKYRRITEAKEVLQEILQRFLADEEDFFEKNSVLTPVPLHFFKKNWRGFNQAEILGKLTAEVLVLEYRSDVLIRQRFTKTQTKLSKKDRLSNVENAFVVNPKTDSITGREIIVVDDVWTTGATIKECSRVLKKAGARRVWALTLARDENRIPVINLGRRAIARIEKAQRDHQKGRTIELTGENFNDIL